MRYLKPLATALALSVGALTFAAPAQADHRWNRHHHRGGGDAAAAGIIGFAAGAILGGALSAPRYHGGYDRGYYGGGYYDEPDVVYVEPRRVYAPRRAVAYQRAAPWTPEWYAYCESRYRSFDPDTGYFLGYDDQFHFCR